MPQEKKNKPGQTRSGLSIVYRLAIGAALAPLIVTVVLGITTAQRLTTETEQAGLSGSQATQSMPIVALKFGSVAVLVILSTMLFGAAKGLVFKDYFSYLGNRLRALIDVANSPKNMASRAPKRAEASNDLDIAVSLVEETLLRELAMYRDAVDEVQTLDERRTEFLGDLSSDLHAPLVKIIDHTKRLMKGEDGPLAENQTEDVRIVATAGKRLLHIVEEILDLSSLIHKGIVYDDKPINLEEVAREVIDTARGGLGKKNLKLSMEVVGDAKPLVRGSRQRIWQILTNLVSNGIKFQDEGEVEVKIQMKDGGRVSIDVKDSGVGIPKEDQEDIFDPFRQRGELSKKHRGTGLGLAICRHLVELHGGEISVSSKEGEGSCFQVILPGAV